MYAVVQIGANQFKVQEGDIINPTRLSQNTGEEITLDKVLMYVNDTDVRVGNPYLKDVKVQAKVVRQTQGEKVVAYKYRLRKDSASKKGHRQKLTALNITKISG